MNFLFVLLINTQGGQLLKLQIDQRILDIKDFFLISLVGNWSLSNLLVATFLFWEFLLCSFVWGLVTHFFILLFFFFLHRTALIDDELSKFVHPQIVAIGEQFDFDKLCIVREGIVLCSIPQQSIVDSIVALQSSFYIFNMWCMKTAKPYCLS